MKTSAAVEDSLVEVEIRGLAAEGDGLGRGPDGRVVFVLPGSRGAVQLAMEKLILPELGHLAAEAVKTR